MDDNGRYIDNDDYKTIYSWQLGNCYGMKKVCVYIYIYDWKITELRGTSFGKRTVCYEIDGPFSSMIYRF